VKKLKILLIVLITIFAFKISVYAASGSLSVSSGNVYVGDTFTVTVNVNSAAAWNVHVSASGPVSGCSINQADATSDAMDTNKKFNATCTATGVGTITITLSGDVTSASDGNAVNISGNKSVVVSTKPASSNNNNNSNNNNKSSDNVEKVDNKSKNNNLKEIIVDGYELTKIDNNNYSLSVPNYVSSININAIAEDSKSKITGAGNQNISVGENNLEIVVTAENGAQNKINIKVTRKDGYYLEDLDYVLKNDDVNNIIIKIDTIITKSDLEKIKNSKKTINFNYYNDKVLSYSWIIDGSKLNNTNDFITTITNDSEYKKSILKSSNYADGLLTGVKQSGSLPTGTRIKLFVGDKYEDNDLINVYFYDKNSEKLELIKDEIKVENGYIQFDMKDASDYFITMSNIPNLDVISEDIPSPDKEVIDESSQSNLIFYIIIGLLSLLVIGLLIILIRKNKKNKKDDNNKNDSELLMKEEKIIDTSLNQASEIYSNSTNQINQNLSEKIEEEKKDMQEL